MATAKTTTLTSQRWIVRGSTEGKYCGFWGKGDTMDEAIKAFRKAGGRVVEEINRFESELPFAPGDRDATEDEADAYISKDGGLWWKRCKRVEVDAGQ